jgi:hypothetical protein
MVNFIRPIVVRAAVFSNQENNAIPTITIRSANNIINPNPAVKHMLNIAAG